MSDTKQRVLYFLSAFPETSQTFVFNQVNWLRSNADVEINVFSMRKGNGSYGDTDFQDLHGYLVRVEGFWYKVSNLVYSVVRYPKAIIYLPRFVGFFSTLRSIEKNISSVTYDTVISHFGEMGVYVHILIEIGLLKCKRHYCFFHGYELSTHHVWHRYKSLYKEMEKTSCLLPISEFWLKKLKSEAGISRNISLHRMGVDVDQLNFNPHTGVGSIIRILTVARLVEKKGIEFVIRAVAILKTKGLPVTYTIVGEGPLRQSLENLVARLSLQGEVRFLGSQSPEEVSQELEKSDLFVLASVTATNGDMEGIPVSLMEAMAKGAAVLTTNHSGISELVDQTNGFLVEEKSETEIASAIALMNTMNYEAVMEMKLNARATVENGFNSNCWNMRLLNMILK